MNPAALRAAILVAELLTFFIVTAFMTWFISHASAVESAPGDAPPAAFPVIAYEGSRDRPDPRGYRVVTWGEWERDALRWPRASLLLPEPSATVSVDRAGQASFTAADAPGSKQTVALTWRSADAEQHVRYIAEARSIEPRYYREVGTRTFLMGALAGFGVGLLVGRALRRRYLAQPRGAASPPT